MVLFELAFEDDHEQVVKVLQMFELVLQGLVVSCQFCLFLVLVALHEESLQGGLVVIECFNLFLVYGDGPLQVGDFPANGFSLFDGSNHAVDFFELVLEYIVKLPAGPIEVVDQQSSILEP